MTVPKIKKCGNCTWFRTSIQDRNFSYCLDHSNLPVNPFNNYCHDYVRHIDACPACAYFLSDIHKCTALDKYIVSRVDECESYARSRHRAPSAADRHVCDTCLSCREDGEAYRCTVSGSLIIEPILSCMWYDPASNRPIVRPLSEELRRVEPTPVSVIARPNRTIVRLEGT
jgi:hypothetical protein